MVKSPIKIIDSGTAPTTANLGEGQIAFGTVDGATKLYGSDGTTVSELGGGGGTEVNSIAPAKVSVGAESFDGGSYDSLAIGNNARADLDEVQYHAGSSLAVGNNSIASDQGSTAIGVSSNAISGMAIGYNSRARNNGTALGRTAKAEGLNSVAIGSNSEATLENELSIGSDSLQRRITHVSDPTDDQDAATKKYVDTKVSEIPAGPQGDPGEPGPQGDPGTPGAAATITVGTTTTGEAGTEAAVTNSGTTSAAVLNFTIPKGAKGDKGDKGDLGPQGPQGEPGEVSTFFAPDYANSQSISVEANSNWTSPSNGFLVVAAWQGVPGMGGRTAFTVNGAAVVDPDSSTYTSHLTDVPVFLILKKGDIIETNFESGINGTFYPALGGVATPETFTDTGWLEITNSSGSGLKYLTGPWSIPVGNKVQIRKFGKRVTVVGMVQATQDIDNTAPVSLISIPESDANFDAFSLPQVSAYELAHNHNKNAATSVQFVNGVLVALNVKQSTETPKISVDLLPFASMAGIPAAKISNGDIVNFQVSWDTED